MTVREAMNDPKVFAAAHAIDLAAYGDDTEAIADAMSELDRDQLMALCMFMSGWYTGVIESIESSLKPGLCRAAHRDLEAFCQAQVAKLS